MRLGLHEDSYLPRIAHEQYRRRLFDISNIYATIIVIRSLTALYILEIVPQSD